MDNEQVLPEFTVMSPPARILPEDNEMILRAGFLMEMFAITAYTELAYIQEKIFGSMTDDENKYHAKVMRHLCTNTPGTTEGEIIHDVVCKLYLADVYALAAARQVPEKDLIAMIRPNIASEKMADTLQRYDMFTTASLLRMSLR